MIRADFCPNERPPVWGSGRARTEFIGIFKQSITFERNCLPYCELTEVMVNLKASPSITKVKQVVLLC